MQWYCSRFCVTDYFVTSDVKMNQHDGIKNSDKFRDSSRQSLHADVKCFHTTQLSQPTLFLLCGVILFTNTAKVTQSLSSSFSRASLSGNVESWIILRPDILCSISMEEIRGFLLGWNGNDWVPFCQMMWSDSKIEDFQTFIFVQRADKDLQAPTMSYCLLVFFLS